MQDHTEPIMELGFSVSGPPSGLLAPSESKEVPDSKAVSVSVMPPSGIKAAGKAAMAMNRWGRIRRFSLGGSARKGKSSKQVMPVDSTTHAKQKRGGLQRRRTFQRQQMVIAAKSVIIEREHMKAVEKVRVLAAEKGEQDRRSCLISPKSTTVKYWDNILVASLVYIAIVTPYDVAFLSNDDSWLVLAMNRLVDLVFTIDIVLNFFLDYHDGIDWVSNHNLIIRNYLTTWFLVDFVAFLPFDLIHSLGFSALGDFVALRFLRLLRLAKMPRIMGTSKRAKSVAKSLSYAQAKVLTFLVLIFTVSHWFACVWRLCIHFEEKELPETWMVKSEFQDKSRLETYIYCYYFAITIITTVGFGDAANPSTSLERVVAMALMLCGAMFWANVLGAICSVIATVEQEANDKRRTLDRLNKFLRGGKFPREMRAPIREYFMHKLQLPKKERRLLDMMSPQMRGTVAMFMFDSWIKKVPWMSRCSSSFLASVALQLEIQLFAPNEVILNGGLHIMRSGVAIRGARVMIKGSVWGIDTIIHNKTLQRQLPVRTITYTEIYHLAGAMLEHLTHSYPEDAKKIRFSVVKLTLQRGLVKYVAALQVSNDAVKDAIAEWAHQKAIDNSGRRTSITVSARQSFNDFIDKHDKKCDRIDLIEWLTDEVGYFGVAEAAKLTISYYGFWNKPKLYNKPEYANKVDLSGFKKAFEPPEIRLKDLGISHTARRKSQMISSKKSFDRFFSVFKETDSDLQCVDESKDPSASPTGAGQGSSSWKGLRSRSKVAVAFQKAVERNSTAIARVEVMQKMLRDDFKMLSNQITDMCRKPNLLRPLSREKVLDLPQM